jgi:hypothetical protein
VVEHSTHIPEIEGSNNSTGREKLMKMNVNSMSLKWIQILGQLLGLSQSFFYPVVI